MAENPLIIGHQGRIGKEDYCRRYGHRPLLLWFTGLSGAGKSTLAGAVEERLFREAIHTFSLDGDGIRGGLNGDLGFGEADRRENIRRIGEMSKLLVDGGLVVLAAFISPFREDRDRVRALLKPGEFVEIHVSCDLATCERRDPKGLYKKARAGEIPLFTGIDSRYEEPENPEIRVDTAALDLDQSVAQVIDYLSLHKGIVPVAPIPEEGPATP